MHSLRKLDNLTIPFDLNFLLFDCLCNPLVLTYVTIISQLHEHETLIFPGKPAFYTEDNRPFREMNTQTGRLKFTEVTRLEKGKVYTAGCLKELVQCINWRYYPSPQSSQDDDDEDYEPYNGMYLTSPNVMYVGDSLFADLVDAKREYGWTTVGVIPEVGVS